MTDELQEYCDKNGSTAPIETVNGETTCGALGYSNNQQQSTQQQSGEQGIPTKAAIAGTIATIGTGVGIINGARKGDALDNITREKMIKSGVYVSPMPNSAPMQALKGSVTGFTKGIIIGTGAGVAYEVVVNMSEANANEGAPNLICGDTYIVANPGGPYNGTNFTPKVNCINPDGTVNGDLSAPPR